MQFQDQQVRLFLLNLDTWLIQLEKETKFDNYQSKRL